MFIQRFMGGTSFVVGGGLYYLIFSKLPLPRTLFEWEVFFHTYLLCFAPIYAGLDLMFARFPNPAINSLPR